MTNNYTPRKYSILGTEFYPDASGISFTLEDLTGVSPENNDWVLVPPFTYIPDGLLCIMWIFPGDGRREAQGFPKISTMSGGYLTEAPPKPQDPATLFFVRRPDFNQCTYFPSPTCTHTEVAKLGLKDNTTALLWRDSTTWRLANFQRGDAKPAAFTIESLEAFIQEYAVWWEDMDNHKLWHNPKFN